MATWTQFTFFGPNWRADFPLLELMFRLQDSERDAFGRYGDRFIEYIDGFLASCGVGMSGIDSIATDTAERCFAGLFSITAIALQRHAGHDVSWSDYRSPVTGPWHRALVQLQEQEAGRKACGLAFKLIHQVPQLSSSANHSVEKLRASVDHYRNRFQSHVPPRVTLEMMRAAERADVPWLWLDQPPFGFQKHRNRLYERGGLLLGQGAHRHIMDGVLCRDRSRAAMRACLAPSYGGCEIGPAIGVKGGVTLLVVANHRAITAVLNGVEEVPVSQLEGNWVAMAEAKSRELDVGVLAMTVTSPLDNTGDMDIEPVIAWDPAPQLDQLLPANSKAWPELADALIEWLYPGQSPSRVPIVCVTGSNGKTTTCRMIEHIARHAGHMTGMSVGDGLYLKGVRVRSPDAWRVRAVQRHALVSNGRVELAVMEFYLAFLKHVGFPFDRCDVGVLTNVTAEHLQPGWEGVPQIAEIKCSVLERSSRGVVLNADDPNTPDLLPRLSGRRIALISSTRPREAFGPDIRSDIQLQLEHLEGAERVIIYDHDKRIDLMGVADIPATIGGAARYNLENVMQAMAAAWLLDIEPEVIVEAMSGFTMELDTTPGRLNICDALPFRVIIDYVHNSDGLRRISEFVNNLQVKGRRILVFAVPGNRNETEIRESMQAVAGQFDYYLCRNYPPDLIEPKEGLPAKMGLLLEEAGVLSESIMVFPDAERAVETGLDMCRPGDLLVIGCGTYEMNALWDFVENWSPGNSYEVETASESSQLNMTQP